MNFEDDMSYKNDHPSETENESYIDTETDE